MPLARPGDPYVSNTGQVLLPPEKDAFGSRHNVDTTIGPVVARTLTPSIRRAITDLPIDAKTQTAINVVLVYQILGLTDNEIAHSVGITIDDVRKLKHLDAYQETFEMMFAELLSANSNSMQAKIAAFAPKALENVMDIANHAKHDLARLKANETILDRSGMHHETLFGKNSNENGFETLKIVIQDGEDQKMSVDIDMKGKRNGNR